jgi:hypothetical protein
LMNRIRRGVTGGLWKLGAHFGVEEATPQPKRAINTT